MNYRYNLLDPRDYLRLLYAVFFDWTELPEPDQRRSQIILVLQALLLIGAINLIVGLVVQSISRQFDWQQMAFGLVFGLAFGVVVTVSGVVAGDVAGGVKLGVMLGVAGYVAFSPAFGVAVGVAVGVMLGMAVGVARGVTYGVAGAVTSAVALGVAGGVNNALGSGPGAFAGLVIALLGFSVAIQVGEAADAGIERIIQRRSAWADWCFGMALLLMSSVGVGYLLSLLDSWVALGAPAPLLTAAIIVLVYTRLPLWPLESIWALALVRWRAGNASLERWVEMLRLAYFDRQIVLPLPGEIWLLRQIAILDYDRAIREVIALAQHSGHLLVSVAVLRDFIQGDPLGVQAHILDRFSGTDSASTNARERLLRYMSSKLPTAPARAWTAQQQIAAFSSRLVLAERWRSVATESGALPSSVRKLLAQPVSESGAEYELEEDLVATAIDQLREAARDLDLAYQLDARLRHVEAFGALYRVLADALEAEGIAAIAAYQRPPLPADAPVLVPWQLQEALGGLYRIAKKAREYAAATAPLRRRDALLQKTEQLELVSQSVDTVPEPYGPLLKLVVNHWRRVLAAAGGELARARLSGPVENPYVIGNPARGPLFVGREDILRRLQELWGQGSGGGPSVVLYGHRRMGKTSILQALAEGTPFGARTIIVDFNMQRLGPVRNTAELLLALARRLQAAAKEAGLDGLAAPARAAFLEDNPYTAFGSFLDRLAAIRHAHRFIVTVDEFEIIERRIEDRQLDKDLLDYWRGTFQTYPWFIMAFAGLHTLQEMRADYWNPLFASVTAVPVSFLTPGSVRRLITAPAPDFAIDYDEDAIDCTYKLTNGQPYLVQLIGHALVTRFNQQGFEAGGAAARRFWVADVEAVINAPEFYQDGNAYFSGVWAQAAESAPPGQVEVLKALSHAALPASEIARVAGLELKQTLLALEALCRHDVLAPRDDMYGYTVELMRRWVLRTLEQVTR